MVYALVMLFLALGLAIIQFPEFSAMVICWLGILVLMFIDLELGKDQFYVLV